MSEVEKKVREELGKIIDKDGFEIAGDANLIEDVGMDSLNILEVFGMIEEQFQVVVDSEKIPEMQTINDIVGIVEEGRGKEGKERELQEV